MNKLKVYVAYRYSANNVIDILANIGKAIKIGHQIACIGHYPYVPHLDALIAIHDCEKELPLEYYYNSSMEYLKVCDVMFLVDNKDLGTSKGVLAEYRYCKSKGIPVIDNLAELAFYGENV